MSAPLIVPFNFQPVSTDVVNGSVGGSSYTIPAGKYANVVCSVTTGGHVQLTPSGGSAKNILTSHAAEAAYDSGSQTQSYSVTALTGSALQYMVHTTGYNALLYTQYTSSSNGSAFTFGSQTHYYNNRTKTSGSPGTASTISIWLASGDSLNAYAPSGGNANLVISLYNNIS